MNGYVSQIVRVPSDLKRAIREAVDAPDGTNQNDLVVGILAKKFRVAFEPTGRASAGVGDAPSIVLQVPAALRTKIKVSAASAGSTQQDVIVAVLSEHFGTRFSSAARRRTRRAA